jgi:chemotaxis protein MotB
MLEMVKKVVEKMPQKIAISGHTDGTKFGAGSEYTNWELSVDRANAARRVLRDLGLPVDRLSRVVGKADTDPLLKGDPNNARNRRLSIVLLRGTAPKAEAEPTGEPAENPAGEPAGEPK